MLRVKTSRCELAGRVFGSNGLGVLGRVLCAVPTIDLVGAAVVLVIYMLTCAECSLAEGPSLPGSVGAEFGVTR